MEDLHWIGLRAVPGIGNVTFRRLLERFETPQAALSAPPAALSAVRGVTPAIRDAIAQGFWRVLPRPSVSAWTPAEPGS